MWGIFAGDDGRMERRDFFWGKQTDGGDGVMEVKVFRARGRMRVVPEVGRWEGLESGGREIRYVLVNLLSFPRSTANTSKKSAVRSRRGNDHRITRKGTDTDWQQCEQGRRLTTQASSSILPLRLARLSRRTFCHVPILLPQLA